MKKKRATKRSTTKAPARRRPARRNAAAPAARRRRATTKKNPAPSVADMLDQAQSAARLLLPTAIGAYAVSRGTRAALGSRDTGWKGAGANVLAAVGVGIAARALGFSAGASQVAMSAGFLVPALRVAKDAGLLGPQVPYLFPEPAADPATSAPAAELSRRLSGHIDRGTAMSDFVSTQNWGHTFGDYQRVDWRSAY